MICSREDTGEGSGQGKVSIKTSTKPGKGLYLLPLTVAIPIITVMILAILRFWPEMRKLLSILIKLVVKS